MLKSFFHTGFVVKNLDKSVDFYANVLGMRKGDRFGLVTPKTPMETGWSSWRFSDAVDDR